MKSFNLNIKNGVRINLNTISLLYNICKTKLVVVFDFLKSFKYLLIILIITKLKKLITLSNKLVADKLSYELGEFRI